MINLIFFNIFLLYKMVEKVLATYFEDKIGMRDNDLYDGGMYYAELSNDPKKKDFKALGGLKNGHKLKITYNGVSVIASKGDVGAGGPKHPKIDLHINLAKALVITKEKILKLLVVYLLEQDLK